MSLSAGHAHHSCAVEKREAGLRQLGNKLLHFLLLLCLHLLHRFVRPWKSDVLEPIHNSACIGLYDLCASRVHDKQQWLIGVVFQSFVDSLEARVRGRSNSRTRVALPSPDQWR